MARSYQVRSGGRENWFARNPAGDNVHACDRGRVSNRPKALIGLKPWAPGGEELGIGQSGHWSDAP